MKCSLVIPTYKRQESLGRVLESIMENTRLPDEVLIIDDHMLEDAFVARWAARFRVENISFTYHQKDHTRERRGLSESKNKGAQRASHEIVLYLDDDVLLNREYFSEIMKVWEESSDERLFMVGGRITNNRQAYPLESLYQQFFGLSGEYHWDINEVGFQVWDESLRECVRVHYIHGGVSSYRREVLLDIPFKVFRGGRTSNEDVEHALHSKKRGYYGIYNPQAMLTHHHDPSGRERPYLEGKKDSQNRREIFKLHCKQNVYHQVWFFWANIGWIMKRVLKGDMRNAAGMVAGLFLR